MIYIHCERYITIHLLNASSVNSVLYIFTVFNSHLVRVSNLEVQALPWGGRTGLARYSSDNRFFVSCIFLYTAFYHIPLGLPLKGGLSRCAC